MTKSLEYYRNLHYKMVWEYDKDDGVYFVKFPELPGCLAHGDTEQEALSSALKTKDEWLEATCAAGWEVPEPSSAPETTGRITTRLPKYLHQKLIDRAEIEGASLNQLIVSFISQGLERAVFEESAQKIVMMQDTASRLLVEIKNSLAYEQRLTGSIAEWWHGPTQMEAYSAPLRLLSVICDSSIVCDMSSATTATMDSPILCKREERTQTYPSLALVAASAGE